jgi:hypothetical protein
MKSLLSLLLAAAATLSADTVYSNVSANGGFVDLFGINNILEAGDQISLNGSGPTWTLNSAIASLYNNSGDSGTANVTLNIYSFSGMSLGALITSSTLNNVSFNPGAATQMTFNGLGGGPVGRDLAWTLQFTGGVGLDLGLEIYTPPGVGTSDSNFALWNTGSGLNQYSSGFGGDDYYFALDATPSGVSTVPEPSSAWLMVLGCVAGLTILRNQRRNRRPQ